MVESSVSPLGRPWPVRWAVGTPVVAAASVIFFARAWGVSWHGYSVATVAVAAWMFAVLAQWSVLGRGRERALAAGALALAGAAVVYWAGWRLPRGLIMTAIPVVALSVFQCLVSLGRNQLLPMRAAAVGGALAAMLVVMWVPLDWPAGVRFALAVVVVAGAVVVWRDAGRAGGGEVSQRFTRSIVFAAGVWLPLVWWRPGALLMEFIRWENVAFVGLVWLVSWSRPVAGAVAVPFYRRAAAVILAGACAAGCAFAAQRDMESPRAVFLGVGVGALVLAGLLSWPRSSGGRVAVSAWWPELALLAMALTPWVWRA